MSEAIEHGLVTEIPWLPGEPKLLKHGGRDGDLVHVRGDHLEDGSLQEEVRIHLMEAFDKWGPLRNQCVDTGLMAPHPDHPAGKLDPRILHHAEIIIRGKVKEGGHGSTPGKIILQHWAGNFPVEMVIDPSRVLLLGWERGEGGDTK